jgi:hypothetical protein
MLPFYTIHVTRSPHVGSYNPAHGLLRHFFFLRVQLLRVRTGVWGTSLDIPTYSLDHIDRRDFFFFVYLSQCQKLIQTNNHDLTCKIVTVTVPVYAQIVMLTPPMKLTRATRKECTHSIYATIRLNCNARSRGLTYHAPLHARSRPPILATQGMRPTVTLSLRARILTCECALYTNLSTNKQQTNNEPVQLQTRASAWFVSSPRRLVSPRNDSAPKRSTNQGCFVNCFRRKTFSGQTSRVCALRLGGVLLWARCGSAWGGFCMNAARKAGCAGQANACGKPRCGVLNDEFFLPAARVPGWAGV